MTSAPPRPPGTGGLSAAGHRSAPARRRTARRRTTTRRRRPAARPSRPKGRRVPRRGRTGIRQWWPGLLVVVAVLVGVAWDSNSAGDSRAIPVKPGTCTLPGTTMTVTTEQAGNAAVIADIAYQRGLPQRALVIALATAKQESGLRNLDYGDRDSLGLFQQRPSQGWGTPAQVRDPVHAANKFFDHLVQVPAWQTGRLTDVAQTVQRSGFPEAYQRWEPLASALAKAVRHGAPRLSCH